LLSKNFKCLRIDGGEMREVKVEEATCGGREKDVSVAAPL
jgi:hypothetical protein